MARALVLAVAVVVVLTATATFPLAPANAQQPAAVTYRPPVRAPVVDHFRPPATPYGPGNRGIEYGTDAGTPVRAAAAGTVTFAGQVGGDLHVTILHADRLRTTYAFLATTAVAPGDTVAVGDVVGTSGDRLLWTARLGSAYLDPAVLLAASGFPSVRLIPNRDTPDGAGGRPLARPVTAAAAHWALGSGP